MTEHDHYPKSTPEKKPVQDDVAKKAYAIYLKDGRPQRRDVQNWLEAEAQISHGGKDLVVTSCPGGHQH